MILNCSRPLVNFQFSKKLIFAILQCFCCFYGRVDLQKSSFCHSRSPTWLAIILLYELFLSLLFFSHLTMPLGDFSISGHADLLYCFRVGIQNNLFNQALSLGHLVFFSPVQSIIFYICYKCISLGYILN